MAFQQAPLRQFLTTGLAGEFARFGPQRAEPRILNSGGVNTIGLAYTEESDGKVQVGGAGVFVGILGMPKEHALVGAGATPLTPNNTLADGIVGTLISMGILYVNLTTVTNNVGAVVTYDTTDGTLSTTAADATHIVFGAKVHIENTTAAGLAIIVITN